MRTIISLLLALFIHVGIFYFLLPKSQPLTFTTDTKLQTIDLTHFNLQKKFTSHQKINPQGKVQGITSLESSNNSTSDIAQTNNLPFKNAKSTFISFSEPEYPKLARAKGLEGKVKIKVSFNAVGEVSNIEILESSSQNILDEAVKKAARTWKVSEANLTFEKTFEFKLNNN